MSAHSQILLTSSEGTEFIIDRDIADKSMLLKCMLEDIGEIGQAVPLPNVSGPILTKVIEYCTHHRDDPNFLSANDDVAADIDEWDLEYCKVDQGTLYELILAANYLDIKPLMDLTCKTVANMIKAKSPEEIRKTFNITNDFTPDEEDQVRRENGLGRRALKAHRGMPHGRQSQDIRSISDLSIGKAPTIFNEVILHG